MQVVRAAIMTILLYDSDSWKFWITKNAYVSLIHWINFWFWCVLYFPAFLSKMIKAKNWFFVVQNLLLSTTRPKSNEYNMKPSRFVQLLDFIQYVANILYNLPPFQFANIFVFRNVRVEKIDSWTSTEDESTIGVFHALHCCADAWTGFERIRPISTVEDRAVSHK